MAAAGLPSRFLFPSEFAPATDLSGSLLRAQLLSTDFPFPYDDRYFACAERITNVRPAGGGLPGARASLNLVPASGKKLDIKVQTADSPAGLSSSKDVFTFYGVDDVLDVELTAGAGPRLYYQVLYREGVEPWKALFPKSVKLPVVSLENGGEIKVILFGDDHTFDDGDYAVPDDLKASKLSGDYVNDLLRNVRFNPENPPRTPADALRNGLCLAQSLRYIMAHEDPDLLINLGDTNGLGAGYKWPGLGLPTVGLADKDYDDIARVLWLRMRKMYSAITPHVPVLIAQGNHDGEEQWNQVRTRAREWRNRLFAMPNNLTYPEGGHPDGLYYALSLGSDASYQGGARFIILHTTAFTGDGYPRTPEGWTLGDVQRQWFERTVKRGEKHWVFACAHHALGGWPAGSNEQDKSMAYGRGPLFTREDYLPYANPDVVEQVKLTDLGRENGLRAFLYGHDHIYFHKKIGQSAANGEMLAVCCGSTKYMGEAGWWKEPYWSKHYGPYYGSNPSFWGPPGITRMTIRKDETVIEYLHTAFTWYSNHPPGAGIGTVLSSRALTSPSPRLQLEAQEISLQATEGRQGAAPGTLRIKNAGGGRLRYELKPDASWLGTSLSSGESWGEWDEITVFARSKRLARGDYLGKIVVSCPGAPAPPAEVKVRLTITPSALDPSEVLGGKEGRAGKASLPPD